LVTGKNESGQHGDGSYDNKTVFTQIALNIKDFGIGVSFSFSHTVLIDNDSKIWMVGDKYLLAVGIVIED